MGPLAVLRALAPAAFLALLTFWSGTFAGGATFVGAASAQAAVLAFALLGAAGWRDPLGLGRSGRWLGPALLGVVFASWQFGSVPRAGIVGLCLLPAYLLVPASVARCWRGPRERWLGLQALGVLVALVASQALVRWLAQDSPRAAMPLGHHNLLAAWLVLLWPLALAPIAARRSWRIPGALIGLATIVALAATGSFLAACALAAQALLAAVWWKRARLWLAAAVVVVWTGPWAAGQAMEWLQRGPAAVVETPAAAPRVSGSVGRAAKVVSGSDSSTRARAGYARAGLTGLSRKPFLGHGPGSVPWTVGQFHQPEAGLNPASEVVGDLHSWPLQLAYETGALGLALILAICWLFAVRRREELATLREPVALEAAAVSLTGGALVFLGIAPAAIAALPAALAVVVGVALSCRSRPRSRVGRLPAGLATVYLVVTVFVLYPLDRAHLAYDLAAGAESGSVALRHLRTARDLDPGFPLYRARAAWLAADLLGRGPEFADDARRAAEDAGSLAPLWLAAGALGLESGRPWAEDALARARTLDPLAPVNAFLLLQARPARTDAVELGAEAIGGDDRLVAAVFWERHRALYARVLGKLGRREPTESGLGSPADQEGATALLVQSMDTRPALSFSLFAFRRSPWIADLAAVEVRMTRIRSQTPP